ncbi:hypothetical protein [Paraburkholderia bannensis]|uniref:hypothetical protein n=1 Tax=Paraburkholderia bannensis TaxID=765414 RepID=UPI002AB6A16A|nr:hypothetical protein [Paraburkholderia bannensis]
MLQVYFLPDSSMQGKLVSKRDHCPIPYSVIMGRIVSPSPELIKDYPSVMGRNLFSERLAHAVIRSWMLRLRTEV